MPKLPKDELERIIERDAPGHTLATGGEGQDERTTRATPEESSPDIAALREKYLGEPGPADAAGEAAPADDTAAGADTAAAGEAADDEIVPVQRTDAGDAWDYESRPKTIVVSGKDKK